MNTNGREWILASGFWIQTLMYRNWISQTWNLFLWNQVLTAKAQGFGVSKILSYVKSPSVMVLKCWWLGRVWLILFFRFYYVHFIYTRSHKKCIEEERLFRNGKNVCYLELTVKRIFLYMVDLGTTVDRNSSVLLTDDKFSTR